MKDKAHEADESSECADTQGRTSMQRSRLEAFGEVAVTETWTGKAQVALFRPRWRSAGRTAGRTAWQR